MMSDDEFKEILERAFEIMAAFTDIEYLQEKQDMINEVNDELEDLQERVDAAADPAEFMFIVGDIEAVNRKLKELGIPPIDVPKSFEDLDQYSSDKQPTDMFEALARYIDSFAEGAAPSSESDRKAVSIFTDMVRGNTPVIDFEDAEFADEWQEEMA